jgi:hypothetical protein
MMAAGWATLQEAVLAAAWAGVDPADAVAVPTVIAAVGRHARTVLLPPDDADDADGAGAGVYVKVRDATLGWVGESASALTYATLR